MKLTLDTDADILVVEEEGVERALDLFSKESFELISRQWLRVGWDQKYVYTYSWMGRPMIQLPDDVVRMQEVVYAVEPDVVVETGIAHGGSLVFYASLCAAMGHGRVIGIDIDIRPHNRSALEAHRLASLITLVEGSSTSPEIVSAVHDMVAPGETVLVVLDSNHSYEHVLAELKAYSDLVTPGSYIVATDGIMRDVADTPRGRPAWAHDNPTQAALDFATAHPELEIVQPAWPFNESNLDANVTHWPGAWLRRRS